MQKELLFHGPASEVITPFTADGRIDFALLEEEIEYLITNGITGVFVNGLASEALMFPTAQGRQGRGRPDSRARQPDLQQRRHGRGLHEAV